jgi:hypothetical protein
MFFTRLIRSPLTIKQVVGTIVVEPLPIVGSGGPCHCDREVLRGSLDPMVH